MRKSAKKREKIKFLKKIHICIQTNFAKIEPWKLDKIDRKRVVSGSNEYYVTWLTTSWETENKIKELGLEKAKEWFDEQSQQNINQHITQTQSPKNNDEINDLSNKLKSLVNDDEEQKDKET